MTLQEIQKQNSEEFKKKFLVVRNDSESLTFKEKVEDYLIFELQEWINQSQLRLISAFKEMVEERIKKIFVDYPDTEEGNIARYENSCRVAELQALLSSLTEETKL